jgi:hypothetical protein
MRLEIGDPGMSLAMLSWSSAVRALTLLTALALPAPAFAAPFGESPLSARAGWRHVLGGDGRSG